MAKDRSIDSKVLGAMTTICKLLGLYALSATGAAFMFTSSLARATSGPPPNVYVDFPAIALSQGQSTLVTATGSPTGGTYSWSNSNPSVVSISGTGNSRTITYVSDGTATVTAFYTYDQQVASAPVLVTAETVCCVCPTVGPNTGCPNAAYPFAQQSPTDMEAIFSALDGKTYYQARSFEVKAVVKGDASCCDKGRVGWVQEITSYDANSTESLMVMEPCAWENPLPAPFPLCKEAGTWPGPRVDNNPATTAGCPWYHNTAVRVDDPCGQCLTPQFADGPDLKNNTQCIDDVCMIFCTSGAIMVFQDHLIYECKKLLCPTDQKRQRKRLGRLVDTYYAWTWTWDCSGSQYEDVFLAGTWNTDTNCPNICCPLTVNTPFDCDCSWGSANTAIDAVWAATSPCQASCGQ